ncbi:MAG: type 3 dihydrofolate reductase [Gammaproteobacteria bacterium]
MISIIAALSQNYVIGHNNQLPWHLSADLRHFKKLTLGKPIVMGRKTFVSIGKPLPGRKNIVVSRDKNFHAEGILVVNSLDAAIEAAADAPEIMITGGSVLFEQAMPLVSRMYLTFIAKDFEGDVFFPQWDKQQWHEVSREDHLQNADNPLSYSFVTLQKK